MDNTFASTLLEWFSANGRDLPWRHTRDPYAIWLSEVILQQTRIVQGMDYWHRFMQTWPDVESLAAASEDDVLKAWQGLGYYSRARNLHTAARQIVELGHFPDTLKEIKLLKGVGDYTAAAIASSAYGIPAAAVDGNVYRVLSRIEGIDTPINSTDGKKVFAALAQSLIPHDRAADFNQAMMDFGATQCTPKSPLCSQCPYMEQCVAYRENRIAELPVKLKTTKVKNRYLTYVMIHHHDKIAIHQRGTGDIWQGLWEPYLLEGEHIRLPEWQGVWKLCKQSVKHVLTHRVLFADYYQFYADKKPDLPPDYIWINKNDIDKYAIPRLIEILLEPKASR